MHSSNEHKNKFEFNLRRKTGGGEGDTTHIYALLVLRSHIELGVGQSQPCFLWPAHNLPIQKTVKLARAAIKDYFNTL